MCYTDVEAFTHSNNVHSTQVCTQASKGTSHAHGMQMYTQAQHPGTQLKTKKYFIKFLLLSKDFVTQKLMSYKMLMKLNASLETPMFSTQ